jgi:ABC-type glycerol-3-phosphate transport system substrate-binding protein
MKRARLCLIFILMLGTLDQADAAKPDIEISMATFYREIIDTWREVAKDFEAETGIRVNVMAAPYSGWQMWVRTQFLGRMQPELLVVESGMAEQYGQAGLALRLNDHLAEPWGDSDEPWSSRFSRSAIKESYDAAGDIWAAPCTMYGIGVFYDRTTYDQLGLKPPATWEQWMANCKVLKDADKTPLAFAIKPSDAQTVWIQQSMLDAMLVDQVAKVDLRDNSTTLGIGRIDLTERIIAFERGLIDPLKQPAFRRTVSMLDASIPYWRPDYLGLDGEQVFKLFAGRKCVHTINGTWYMLELNHLFANMSAADSGLVFDWSTFPLPAADGMDTVAPISGTRAYLMITKQDDPAREQAALRWLRYLTRPEVAQKIWDHSGLYDLPALNGVHGQPEAEALRPKGELPIRQASIDGYDQLSRHNFWVLSQRRIAGSIDIDEFLSLLSDEHRDALIRLSHANADRIDRDLMEAELGTETMREWLEP